ncbi:MAG: UDP-2,4-diacetamido-2,4,6-trideoxy-beta-L-altropyranose hydrolase, partial [Verrucomicrobiaceae bacterium]|nr:UDP-2,4-diacetamido-2,4,6-trideoxy-beta-L-altropyranose hydrolase [Verrucomicrobiaceae bacterium]
MSSIGTLCIRADANPSIGMGHVMRCLALAQAWQDRGGHVVLVSALQLPALIDRMKAEKLELVPVTAEPGSADDLAFTIATAQRHGARWIVLDGYFFTPDYMHGIQKAGLHLLLLDDVADRELGGIESILNQNAYATPELYARFQPAPHLLLSSPHTLLRREFLQRRGAKSIADIGTRVVITMGGADPANVTQQVMQALARVSKHPLEVRILVGAANRNLPALQEALPHLQAVHQAEILVNSPDVPGHMAWSDVTITAAGSSCWELFCLGVPA